MLNGQSETNMSSMKLTYNGGSMRSLFRQGDRLRVQPCLVTDVRAGDVIVYLNRSRDRHVVHRVMHILSSGFETRGDDRITADKELVIPDQFVGRVIAVWRSHSWKPVRGGIVGLIRSRLWQSMRMVHHSVLTRSIRMESATSPVSNPDVILLPHWLLQLLQSCLRGTLQSEINKIPENVWPSLVALASRQDLAPFIYANLNQQDALDELPASAQKQLHHLHQNSWIAQQRLMTAHTSITHALNEASIDSISLKGLWFAHSLYEDPASRPMVDIDLLVRPEQLTAATDVFIELGYVSIQEHDSVSLEKEIWLYHPERRIKVDLHQDLIPYYSDLTWDTSECWTRAIQADLEGQPIQVLSLEDQMMHIILHGSFEHLFQPHKVLLDAYLAIQTWGAEVDWKRVRERAETIGLGHALDLMVVTLRRAFDDHSMTLPAPIRHVPADGVRWLLYTAPILHPPSLLHLYAGRDYLFYVLKRARQLATFLRSGVQSQGGIQVTRSKPKMVAKTIIRRMFTLSGLTAGFLYGSIRHPSRKQFIFLKLLNWLSHR